MLAGLDGCGEGLPVFKASLGPRLNPSGGGGGEGWHPSFGSGVRACYSSPAENAACQAPCEAVGLLPRFMEVCDVRRFKVQS